MRSILYILVLIVLATSCSPKLTPFTTELRSEYKWKESELERIQFYLSDDIVLYREVKESEVTNITNGVIKVKNGRHVEEITFPSCTPGVFIREPKTNRFAVSFESDNNFLMFGPKRRGSDFVLLAADWNRNSGKISYNGKIYYTDSSSAYARLLVDMSEINKSSVKRKTVKGRKIGK